MCIIETIWNFFRNLFLFVCVVFVIIAYGYVGICIGSGNGWWIYGHDWWLTYIFVVNNIPWYFQAVIFLCLPFLVCVFVGILVFAVLNILSAPFRKS